MSTSTSSGSADTRRGLLDWIEWLGNKLPDPVLLFVGLTVLVVLLSAVGAAAGWKVQPIRPVPVVVDGQAVVAAGTGRPQLKIEPHGEPVVCRSLMTSEGVHWLAKNLVSNFINFPPLGVVLVGVLGVGLAEKVGLFGAVMRSLALVTPAALLTPMIVFLGVMSSLASDAGYIVLPGLAAALYATTGRSPVVGVAAAFAGIAGGFSANLLPSAGDALLAGMTTTAAEIVAGKNGYAVTPVANWYFIAASTVLLTLMGWAVTAWVVEPRLKERPAQEGGPLPAGEVQTLSQQRLSADEQCGLWLAAGAFAGVIGVVVAMAQIPGWPLHGVEPARPGSEAMAPKWTGVVVPIIFCAAVVPGLAYGWMTGVLRSQKDVAEAFFHAMRTMAPVIVLAFFAAQFTACLGYTRLDQMLAFVGGEALLNSGLPPKVMLVGLVLVSLTINLFIGSMSAKWAILAPVIVPMLMIVGISPELSQAAYRVGDSVTNIITPLNTYMLLVLVVMQRYWKSAGMGTLIATMVPYSLVFTVGWTLLLLVWVMMGWKLGPDAGLWYPKPIIGAGG